MDAYHLARPLYEAQQALSAVNAQLASVRELAGDEAPEALRAELGDVTRDVRQVQQRLQEVGQGAGAGNAIQSFVGPPTEDQLWQIDRSWRDLPDVIGSINQVIVDRMPGLIAMVYQPGVGPEPIATVEVPARPVR
jgi:peptidoglycan hydrolase-like protein with peptidoglycan-binding domain